MNAAPRVVTLIVVAVGVVGLNRSALAQSMDGEFSGSLERTSSTAVHRYQLAEIPEEGASIPPNITLPRVYRGLLETMFRRSPTFRRQCQRVADEPRLTVTIQLERGTMAVGTRAMTSIRRLQGGIVRADIHVNSADDAVELLSHELEHVIEQLDQIDLAAKSAQPGMGVRSMVLDVTLFETTRATRTGQRVAQEMRGGARRGD